jgi:UDP-2,4-diacetamido-2,4,6-trideoxy-beta-L-altropyranose hydrolase
MTSAVFRCDASPAIGSGHVVRCSALAQVLAARGWKCRIVALPGTCAAVAGFVSSTIEVIETEAADDPATVAKMLPKPCELLVIDSYRLGRAYEDALGPSVRRRLVIEDLPNRPHHSELLLDQTFGRTPGEYGDLVPPNTKLLLGADYALVRPAFAAVRRKAVERHLKAEPLATLLVALGGAPTPELLERVLAGVQESGLPLRVHVVGPLARHAMSGRAARVIAHGRGADMPGLMAECDVALGAGGGSAWERCCLGLPSLIVQVADNQKDVAASLAAAGAAVDLGSVSRLSPAAIAQALRALAGDPARRGAMADCAARLCDGLGVRRVCGVLAPRLSGDGRPVTLRPVAQDDARLLFEWQLIPEVRRYANDPRPPTWEGHLAWFRRRIGDALAGPFSVIMLGGRAVGVLRLDSAIPERLGPNSNPEREAFLVSILVDPQCQGRGVAAAALAAGRDLLPQAVLYAEVLEGNEPSHRLFSNAGYRRTRPRLYVLNS